MADDMTDETEEFLAHFGVVGMKWGRQKARFEAGGSTNRERNRAEARYQVQKSGGSKVKASFKIAGKVAAQQVIAGVGVIALSKVAGPRVSLGAARVTTIFGIGSGLSGVADIVRIARS